MSPLKKPLLKLMFCFASSLLAMINIAQAQACGGSWALQRPLTSQCVSGQWIGWQNMSEPAGCPTNPVYTGVQTNTFTFDNPVSGFSIDFRGFDGNPLCARMEVRVNGIFYPLTSANLIDFSLGSTCTSGSFSYVTLTSDGYITSSGGPSLIGQGRITINNVNATSVSISTNDWNGTLSSNPFNCIDIVPLKLESFTGNNYTSCRALLSWKTGTEVNIKNIEMQRSEDGFVFEKLSDISPKGSNSQYSITTANPSDAYFRLKIIDLDGNYEYSEILVIKSTCNNISYQVKPNPAISSLQVTNIKKGDRLLILDMLGRNVMSFDSPQNNKSFDIQQLASGMYILRVINTGVIKANIKFIKN